jgi:hypothetical protein
LIWAVPITKLSAESVYLNNFSKMRVNLAVHTLNPIVAQEMLEHENYCYIFYSNIYIKM